MTDRLPTPQEAEILTIIPLYTYMTIDQIMKHLGQDASNPNQLRNMQIKLKNLTDHEDSPVKNYLDRINRQDTGGKGKLKAAYRILTKAQRYLHSQGIEVKIPPRPESAYLNHVLAINDVILLARELARSNPYIELRTVLHDFDMKAMQLSIIPDIFIHLLVHIRDAIHSYPLLIEVDRGKEPLKRKDPELTNIADKVKDYIEFMKGEYQNQFGLTTATIVFFVTGDIKRIRNIQGVIEEVLTEKNLKQLGQFFYIGRLEDNMTPSVLLNPYFYVPFQKDKLFPLLAKPPPPWFDTMIDIMTPRYQDTAPISIFEQYDDTVNSLKCPHCLRDYTIKEMIRIYDVEIREWRCNQCENWFIT